MVEILHWPHKLLVPEKSTVSQVAFTRSGGRSLGGIERTTKTDRGFWRVSLEGVYVTSQAHRRTWNAIRSTLNGRQGLIAVPAWSFDSAPYPSGEREFLARTPHDDGSPFDDGSLYSQGSIDVQMASFAPLGSTVVTLRLVNAASASGIRFSYENALYETGRILAQSGDDTFQVPVFPALRQAIPAGAQLECDEPTVLCHLADDRGMDLQLTNVAIDAASVDFVEAVDYWSDLALGLA